MPPATSRATDGNGNLLYSNRTRTLVSMARNLAVTMLVAIGIVEVLSELGVNANALLAGAGVVGLAIGFGAQTLVKDLITGLFILVGDTVRVGDVVDLGGKAGVVEAISMRTITLRAYNGDVHTIPYSSIDVVTNMTKDFSFYVFDLVVAYKEDVDRVIEVLREIDSQLRREWPYRRLMLEPLEIAGRRRLPRFRRPGQGAHQGQGRRAVEGRARVQSAHQATLRRARHRAARAAAEGRVQRPRRRRGRRGDAAGADAPSRRRGLMRAGLGMRGAALVAALLLAGCGDDGERGRPVGRGRHRAAGRACRRSPTRSTLPGDLPPELGRPVAASRRQRRAKARHRRPAGSPSASAPRPTGPSWSRRLRAQGYFDGTVGDSRSSTSAEAPPQTAS